MGQRLLPLSLGDNQIGKLKTGVSFSLGGSRPPDPPEYVILGGCRPPDPPRGVYRHSMFSTLCCSHCECSNGRWYKAHIEHLTNLRSPHGSSAKSCKMQALQTYNKALTAMPVAQIIRFTSLCFSPFKSIRTPRTPSTRSPAPTAESSCIVHQCGTSHRSWT